MWLPCEFLGAQVELTAERERHIRRRHPNVAIVLLADALADPDIAIRRPWLLAETLLVRRVDDGAGGTHIVVAVVTDEPQTDSDSPRLWVATAFLSEELPLGTVIWERR